MDQAYEALQWASKIWFRLLNLFQGLGFWWFGLSRNGGKAMISKKTPSLCKDFLLPGSENFVILTRGGKRLSRPTEKVPIVNDMSLFW